MNNCSSSRPSKFVRRGCRTTRSASPFAFILSVTGLLCALHGPAVLAQAAAIDFTSSRNFIYSNGSDALQPFVISISNPAFTPLLNVQFSISMPAAVRIGNVDQECVEASTSTTRQLNCVVPSVAANSVKLLDFFVDGPNSVAVGPSFTLSINSPSVAVIQPTAFSASLADGDASIRGSNLTMNLVRNISFDGNQNKVPDIDEAIMKLPAATPAAEMLAREAVIDLLVLYSPAARQYLDNKLGGRIAQLVTASNQLYRENGVAIKFLLTGQAEIPYVSNDSSIFETFNALQAGTNPAFSNLTNMVQSSGADLVVFLHALPAGSSNDCARASSNALGRQGDFQRGFHQGRLRTAVNIGPDCLGLRHLASEFATNMGIVPTRADQPDGGTFSYSAGYGVIDVFTTLMAREGGQSFGIAQALNRFSNPESYCSNLRCGIERASIASGTDAVYSLNKTRHVVSALSNGVFSKAPGDIPNKLTVLSANGSENSALEIIQTPLTARVFVGEYAEFQVTIRNNSTSTLSDLVLAFGHLNGGTASAEIQTYRSSAQYCTVFSNTLATSGTLTNGVLQKSGILTCLIESLAPGQTLTFNYSILIDATPPSLNGNSYYHELVSVNNVVQQESVSCIPVFASIVQALIPNTVCDEANAQYFGTAAPVIDLNALPLVTGSRISVPFIRLFDGSLLAVELNVTSTGAVELQLASFAYLDSALLPAVESTYNDLGELLLRNLVIAAITYDVRASYVIDSNPITFTSMVITQTSP